MSMTTIKNKSKKQYKTHLTSRYKTKYNTKYNTKKNKKHSNINNNPNTNIIHILTLVKNYYNSLRNTIHVNAYERAIYQISKWGKPITAGKELSHLEGIGKGMIEKIDTIIKTGTLPIVSEKHLEAKPSLDTIHILGFGEKLTNELKSKYNARTINDVRKLVANNKIKLTHTQTIGLKYYEDLDTLIPRDEIKEIGDKIKQILTNNTNTSNTLNNKQYNVNVFLAGSYPSGLKAESKDIDILIIGDSKCISLKIMVEDISRVMMLETLSLGSTKFLGIIKNKNGDNITTAKWRHLDMRFVNAESFPYAWMYYSSGKIFNKMIREKLKKKGYKLNEWGLYHSNKNINNNNKKVNLGEDISKYISLYINTSLDTKTKCDTRLKDEDLIKYKDVIEKKIFEKADMEYKNVKERY